MQHDHPEVSTILVEVEKAIARSLTLRAVYKGRHIEIEPYVILVRNDALYLGAYNPSKARRHDAEPTLGMFNISGLSSVSLGRNFVPVRGLRDSSGRDGDRILLSVDS